MQFENAGRSDVRIKNVNYAYLNIAVTIAVGV